MGILNVTPDSFSDAGEFYALNRALEQGDRLLAEGADLIDIGGESTRPGADEVSIDEELARVLPVVSFFVEQGAAVSVDTRHVEVATACIEAGAAVINDVSGFRDPAMHRLVADSDVGCVVMHMLGEPKSMQVDPFYDDVVAEVKAYLLKQAGLLESSGVNHESICIDPGPGFGKVFSHNLSLLQATSELAGLGYPLMAAYSRKGFIGSLAGIEVAADRVTASVLVAAWAVMQGARVVRVHDVLPTVQALAVLKGIGAVEGSSSVGTPNSVGVHPDA
jgi:dihydropteroate synthase